LRKLLLFYLPEKQHKVQVYRSRGICGLVAGFFGAVFANLLYVAIVEWQPVDSYIGSTNKNKKNTDIVD